MASKIIGGVATVAAPGTAVPLSATSKVVRFLAVTCSVVSYLGGSDVLAASLNGAKLAVATPTRVVAGRKGFGGGIDLAEIWVDSATAGAKVGYLALED